MEELFLQQIPAILAIVVGSIDWPLAFCVLTLGIVITDYLKIGVYRFPFAVAVWILGAAIFSTFEWLAGELDWMNGPRRLLSLPVAMLAYDFLKARGIIQKIRGRKK